LEQAEQILEALGHDDVLYFSSGSNDLPSIVELNFAISLKGIAKQHVRRALTSISPERFSLGPEG
jgi:hypothetical protein